MRLAVLAISLTLFMSPARSADVDTSAVLANAPDFTQIAEDGTPLTLSETVARQPVILFFWATWCPYCKALMPHLQSIRLEHGEDVKILALHFRDDDGDPVGFMQDAGYDFTLLQNGQDVAKLYEVWGTPGVIIVDSDMKIRFNLYALPPLEPPPAGKSPDHKSRAAYLAPYWAAEIRKTLQVVLDDDVD